MKKKILLVDGSAVLNTQYHGNMPDSVKLAKKNLKIAKTPEEIEKAKEDLKKSYNDILHTKDGVYTNAVYGFMKFLIASIKAINPEYLVVTWDVSRNTFRRDLMPEYKGNRSETEDPLKQQFKTCQELLSKIGIKQFFSTTYESDDYCGTLVKKFESEADIQIITKDHDFFQLISDNTNVLLLCQTMKQANELNTKYSINTKDIPMKTFLVNKDTLLAQYDLTPEAVTLVKGLAGDTADNIPGIPNIGDKTAIGFSKIYKSVEEVYNEIEGKSDDEISNILADWKKLGIKKSPIKALTEKAAFTTNGKVLSAKEVGILSQTLATIKTDIDLDINLSDLKLNYDKTVIASVLKEYDIISLKL